MAFAIGTPMLDSCVLAVLAQGDTYGYILTQQIRQVLDISESTLYPVLRRLLAEGCLAAYDQAYQGRNRRYYTITDVGRERLGQYRAEWKSYRTGLDRLLLGEEESHGQA